MNEEKLYMQVLPMFPNMIPFSVEATLTLALILQKSCGAMVIGVGFSTSFKSPRIIHISLMQRIHFAQVTTSCHSYNVGKDW